MFNAVTNPTGFDPNEPDKYYVVTAVNAIGEGPYCKEIQATGGGASPCALPGILTSNDVLQNGADDDAGQNTPIDPRVNAKAVFVAEPFVSTGTEQIFFTLQVEPSTMGSAPPNSQWYIIWNRQDTTAADYGTYDRAYVAMTTDAAGTPQFEYGRFGIPINTVPPPPPDPNANTPDALGSADPGSEYNPLTGVIKIVLSNSKLRAMGGAASADKYMPGSTLTAVNARTYFGRIDPGQRSQNNASDITPDGSYTLVGNNVGCAPQGVVEFLDAFSRKTHGVGQAAQVFDIRLGPLPAGGEAVTEPRRGDGDNQDTHHVVFVFPQPVNFTGATVDAAQGGTTGTTGNVTTTPAPGTMASEVIVNFTATNEQIVNVNLTGVSVGGAPNPVSVPMGILLGDVVEDEFRRVDGADVMRARQNNFRPDAHEKSPATRRADHALPAPSLFPPRARRSSRQYLAAQKSTAR